MAGSFDLVVVAGDHWALGTDGFTQVLPERGQRVFDTWGTSAWAGGVGGDAVTFQVAQRNDSPTGRRV